MLHFGKLQHFGTPQGTVKVRNFKFNSNPFLQPRPKSSKSTVSTATTASTTSGDDLPMARSLLPMDLPVADLLCRA